MSDTTIASIIAVSGVVVSAVIAAFTARRVSKAETLRHSQSLAAQKETTAADHNHQLRREAYFSFVESLVEASGFAGRLILTCATKNLSNEVDTSALDQLSKSAAAIYLVSSEKVIVSNEDFLRPGSVYTRLTLGVVGQAEEFGPEVTENGGASRDGAATCPP